MPINRVESAHSPTFSYDSAMSTKKTDSKGRLTLGERFANRTVIVEEIDETEVRISLARVVPEREMWLHDNRAASATVRRGLTDAKKGRLSIAPDLASDAILDAHRFVIPATRRTGPVPRAQMPATCGDDSRH